MRRATGTQVSGSRPDERDPQLLTNTLGKLMREQGWEVDVAVHGVMARWPSIVGPEMASHCKPESYQDTELTVRTDSTAWATQLKMLAPDLVHAAERRTRRRHRHQGQRARPAYAQLAQGSPHRAWRSRPS